MRHAARRSAPRTARVLLTGLAAVTLGVALGLATLAALVAAGVVAAWPEQEAAAPGPPMPIGSSAPEVPASDPTREGPRTVLAAWDRSRAQAWRDGDEASLRALYVRGSPAARADLAMLHRWTSRGLRVLRLRMRVQRLRVEASGPDRLVLRVTDRLGDPVAVLAADPTVRHHLPRDELSTRRLVLARGPAGWRMAQVRPVAPEQRSG